VGKRAGRLEGIAGCAVTADLARRRFRGSIPCHATRQVSTPVTGATGRSVANSELAQVSSDGLVVTIGHDRWQEDWEVKLHKPGCARSVLGPCHNGRTRA
jgi:hypothetical protein